MLETKFDGDKILIRVVHGFFSFFLGNIARVCYIYRLIKIEILDYPESF